MSDERTADTRADGALALELYASAVLATRASYARLAQSDPPVSELERIAEQIARGAANPAHAVALPLASLTRDDASRAVQCAFLATRCARRAADHDRDLIGVALAALLVDSGRARLASASALDLNVFSELPDTLDLLAPAATAALGVSGPRSAVRESATLAAFEVAWLERPRLGPLYRGALAPRLLSRLLLVCRALLARVAPGSHADALSPFDALSTLTARPDADLALLRLLADSIGHVPTGTMVELRSGEWGVVGPEPGRVIWGLVDARGRARDRLARVEPTDVVRVVAPSEGRFNPAFPLVAPRGPGAK